MPFNEETNVVFMDHQANALNFVAIYFFLAVTFSLTTLSFMPVGQLCGRLMMRMEPLRAYSWNLLGSIVGIAVMLLLSTFWTPPVVWFAVAFTGCFVFTIYHRRPMLVTGAGAIVALIALAWPVNFLSEVVYSPYQMLERGKGEHGWSVIKAAGQYYQRILDLSPAAQQAYPELKPKAAYYDFVFQAVPKVGDVAIVGAGTGNDVAAALRGKATHVDAVELDPAILGIGLAYHPENPYKDPRVNRVVDDARAFMRSTDKKYDTIVMGLLDSHTLVSQASSLRVDSYVYTVEALKNARSRLKDNGSLSLAFAVYAPDLGHKLYRMMTEAFDGKPPVCVSAQHYDSAMIFIQSKDGDYKVPPGLVEKIGFKDVSSEFAAAQSSVAVATDDWPFFYMTQRVFPVSYIPMALLVLAMSFAFFVSLYGQKPQASALPFALLGAGFMLIETKAITELGLHFGNTWAINGIVIGAILLMAFFSNLAVLKLDIKNPAIPFILLLATIGAGLFVSYNGGFPSTAMGKLAAAVVLTSPIFFSGIVFSCLLKAHGNIDSAMFMNLLGAMFGGLLEYNAMYFGYRALYVIALAIYLLAFLMAVRKRSSNTQTSSASAPSTA
jgi:spermidine synthase